MRGLLIHASLGAGHKRAAQALSERLNRLEIPHEVRDLLEFLPHPVDRFYSWAYHSMITNWRGIWRLFYRAMDRSSKPYAPAKSRLQRWQFKPFLRYLQQQNPDFVVSTHFTPSSLLTDWRESGLIESRIFSVVTDHVSHRCWKRKGLDHYFVPSDAVSLQMQAAGIAKSQISATGIPISEAFSRPLERKAARAEWGIGDDETLLLVLCSALSKSNTLALLRQMKTVKGKLRFLVSTGSDPEKEEHIREAFQNDREFTIFGFSTRIAEMMRAADLVVTKPGGLIVSEALATGLPLILLSPIPGQEEANARHASDHGAAICLEKADPMRLSSLLDEVLSEPNKLADMSQSARAIGRPNAAKTIVDTILAEQTERGLPDS